MSSVIDYITCPKCGMEEAYYEENTRLQEYFCTCGRCGYYKSSQIKRNNKKEPVYETIRVSPDNIVYYYGGKWNSEPHDKNCSIGIKEGEKITPLPPFSRVSEITYPVFVEEEGGGDGTISVEYRGTNVKSISSLSPNADIEALKAELQKDEKVKAFTLSYFKDKDWVEEKYDKSEIPT